MGRLLIGLLIATNLATAYQAWVYKTRLELATSDKTTIPERDRYGLACVEWMNERFEEFGIKVALARSWKKHGQLVFEIIPESEDDWKKARENRAAEDDPIWLCTYDKQSGTMAGIAGDERKRWMFYE